MVGEPATFIRGVSHYSSYRDNVPHEWTSCTHPEGRLYFYHPRRVRCAAYARAVLLSVNLQRIYTDADVRDSKNLATIEAFANQLDDMVQEQGLTLPADYDLVLFLEKRRTMPGINWIYYYADHSTRSLFWVQECHPVNDFELIEVRSFFTSETDQCTLLVSVKSFSHDGTGGRDRRSRVAISLTHLVSGKLSWCRLYLEWSTPVT